MSGDRLTRLPDTVLWQVLSHAPAKEAVCTGALSRPWRSLWLSSGVLNLDSRSYGPGRSFVFLRDANAALRAIAATAASGMGSRLRKLTINYLTPDDDEDSYSSQRHIDDGLDALLTGAPAVRNLEELHIHVSPCYHYCLCVASLPSDTLRALHLDGLLLTAPASFPRLRRFPRLEMPCLRRCAVRLTVLHAIVDAAPLLTALELDLVHLSYELGSSLSAPEPLRCPRVTALSLANLRHWGCRLEFDAPSLRHFSYKGSGGMK